MLYLVKYATEKAGRHHTVITNDKQLFKIATQITWWQPEVSKKIHPVLGGMHMLMSFI